MWLINNENPPECPSWDSPGNINLVISLPCVHTQQDTPILFFNQKGTRLWLLSQNKPTPYSHISHLLMIPKAEISRNRSFGLAGRICKQFNGEIFRAQGLKSWNRASGGTQSWGQKIKQDWTKSSQTALDSSQGGLELRSLSMDVSFFMHVNGKHAIRGLTTDKIHNSVQHSLNSSVLKSWHIMLFWCWLAVLEIISWIRVSSLTDRRQQTLTYIL